jgi:hypothetical protein
MYSKEDVTGVYNFLKDTPEGNLRKMLVAGSFTDAHFRLIMKMVKNSPEADFVAAFENETVPKFAMSPAEGKIKEGIWPAIKSKMASMGLLGLNKAAA